MTAAEQKQPCPQLYRTALELLLHSVQAIASVELRLFQTTTAAWPKYGNYGVAWSPRFGQGLPLDPSFVAPFNQIAWDVLKRHDNIQVVDGYWMSLARPDNREVDGQARIGKKLSHPGTEVLMAMVQLWSHVVVQTFCQN